MTRSGICPLCSAGRRTTAQRKQQLVKEKAACAGQFVCENLTNYHLEVQKKKKNPIV